MKVSYIAGSVLLAAALVSHAAEGDDEIIVLAANEVYSPAASGEMTVSTPIRFDGAASINVPEGVVLTLTGEITIANNRAYMTKTGDGKLVLAGTETSAAMVNVAAGVLELARTGTPSVSVVRSVDAGAVLLLGVDNPFNGWIALTGGTLDMNGHSARIDHCNSQLTDDSSVVNSGAGDAVLTWTDTRNDRPFHAQVVESEGCGKITLAFETTRSMDLTGSDLQNKRGGIVVSNGRITLAPAFASPRSIRYVRFSVSDTRPDVQYSRSGMQISEVQFLMNGEPVSWPAGTQVAANRTQNNGATCANLIDGEFDNNHKMYVSEGNWNRENGPIVIDIDTGTPVSANGFRWASADAQGRDPWAYSIAVSTDGENWTTIDEITEGGAGEWQQQGWYPAVACGTFGSAVDTDYPIAVASPGVVEFANVNQTLSAVSGTGVLRLSGEDARLALAAGYVFNGTLEGGRDNMIGVVPTEGVARAIVASSDGSAVANMGQSDAVVAFNDGATWNSLGTFADAADAKMGVLVANGTTLNALGTAEDRYSGPTTIGNGSAISVGSLISGRYFRFTVSSVWAGNGQFQASEFELVRNGVRVDYPAGTIQSANKGFKSGQTLNKMFDGDISTKAYCSNGTTPEAPLVMTVDCGESVAFDGYRWYTASDSVKTERNPKSWTLEVSEDNATWVLVDSQENYPQPTSNDAVGYERLFAASGATGGDALSDVSPVSIAQGGVLRLWTTGETVGSLSGAGTVQLFGGASLGVNAIADSAFSGSFAGDGILVVEGTNTLDITGADLSGLSAIVVRGGCLVGSAGTTGDLAVSTDGGAYAATIAVGGTLTIDGPLTLASPTGDFGKWTAFTFGSLAEGSAEAFEGSTFVPLASALQQQMRCTAEADRLVYSIRFAGFSIIIR